MTGRDIGSKPLDTEGTDKIIPSKKPAQPAPSKQVESHRQATGEKVAATLNVSEFSDGLSSLIALFKKHGPLNENDISALKAFDKYLNASHQAQECWDSTVDPNIEQGLFRSITHKSTDLRKWKLKALNTVLRNIDLIKTLLSRFAFGTRAGRARQLQTLSNLFKWTLCAQSVLQAITDVEVERIARLQKKLRSSDEISILDFDRLKREFPGFMKISPDQLSAYMKGDRSEAIFDIG